MSLFTQILDSDADADIQAIQEQAWQDHCDDYNQQVADDNYSYSPLNLAGL